MQRAYNMLGAARDQLWRLLVAHEKKEIDLKNEWSNVNVLEQIITAEIEALDRGERYEDEEEDPEEPSN